MSTPKYRRADTIYIVVCDQCGNIVSGEHKGRHTAFHAVIDKLIKRLSKIENGSNQPELPPF